MLRRASFRRSALTAAVAAGLGLSLGLAGCSEDPRLLNANTGGIAIALGDPENALSQATEVASQHCVNVRRIAVLRDVQEVGDEQVAFFDCVAIEPAAR
ncbi:hypothetical protein C882_0250 [Caenispirillum salinarum AK4]|uniref:Lipoprotein n=1 Tax=Caenispirillum salinarum AK4 TaxID=1238182 RepID=K9GV02_9PROT|nr:hypothetical protein [Caenispirillum salinarum]EKV29820.1 hypothetical protein C882_0250 [Caenispirillum salinarum AK4]